MPTTISFSFPNSKKVDHLIQEVKEAPIVFSVSEADQHFTVQTQTQKIEFRNNRFFLNNQIVNGLADTGASTVENNDLQGYFHSFQYYKQYFDWRCHADFNHPDYFVYDWTKELSVEIY